MRKALKLALVALAFAMLPSLALALVTASPAVTEISFNPAAVGVSTGSAQTLMATFTVSGYAGSFTPAATAHYGKDFSLGAVNCTPSGASETCTVAITFIPTLPGIRRDAIFLTDGAGTRLATVQLAGTGQSPLALIQPGNVLSTLASTPAYYNYNSTVDENGTVYSLTNNTTTNIARIDNAGTVTWLPVTGNHSIGGIAIDGAGVLYIGLNGYGDHLLTYDTVTGAQNTLSMVPPGYTPCSNSGTPGSYLWWFAGVSTDESGNVYANETLCEVVIEHKTDGTFAWYALNPTMTQLWNLTVDAGGTIFPSGYAINKIVPGGAQTQVNSLGANEGIAVDAADSLYATRYTTGPGSQGIAVLPASDYTTYIAALEPAATPLGESLGADGTVYVGNYTTVDKVDRSQGLLDFATQNVGAKSAVKTTGLYNGGNQPLALSDIAISGDGYSFVAAASNGCTTTTTLAPGEFCNIDVTVTPTHGGNTTGTIVFTDDSLNGTSATQTIALKAAVNGAYLTAAPPALDFGNVAVGSTSSALIVTLTDNGIDYSFTGAPSLGAATIPSSAFSVDISKCNSLVAGTATASCSVPVTFTPTAATSYSGTVTIPYTSSLLPSGAKPTVTFTVAGNGGASGINISPATIPFGSLNTGLTSPANTVTVSNNGSAPLHISAITLTGSNPGQFQSPAGGSCSTSTPVAAGGSCSILVAFAPTSAASFSANLVLTDDAPGSPQSVALSGTGATATVTFSPSPLDFGNVQAGSASGLQLVTLSNPGPGALNITNIAASGGAAFTLGGGTCTTVTPVAAGASCTIGLTFAPNAAGPFSGTLTVTDNAASSPQTVALSGTGVAPTVMLTPSPLDFGNVGAGSVANQVFTLSNTGPGALNITNIAPSGGAAFSLTGGTCTTITPVAAGASCTIGVSFLPNAAGAFSGSLIVTDNGVASPQTDALSGTGVASTVTLSPSPFNFGNVVAGTVANQVFTLSNTGPGSLQVTNIATSGGAAFSLTGGTCTTVTPIAAGANCTIGVAFLPNAAGAFSGSLIVTDNGVASPQTVALSGTGVVPTLTVSPAALNFTAIQTGTTSAPQTLTVTNTSAFTVTFTGFSVFGAGAGSFNQTNTCGATLAGGATCTVTVTFTAASVPGITTTQNLFITDNAFNSPQNIPLSGVSLAAVPNDFTISTTPGTATVAGGGVATFTITVTPNASGFPRDVVFSVAGLPVGATATFSPTSVVPNNAPATLTMTVQTIALAQNETPDNGLRLAGFGGGVLALIGVLLAALLGRARRRMRGYFLVALAFFAAAAATGLTGCANPKLAPVTSTLTITGTHSSTVHTTTVQLTVQ